LLEVVFLVALASKRNQKLDLHMPFLVPSKPWESISMDFVGGLPMSRKGHNYLPIVVDPFSKMYVLIPFKKMISGHEATKLFFNHVWVHLGLLSSIISN
jgi:hypothetical protein